MRTNKLLQYLFIFLIIAVSANKAYSQALTSASIREDVEIFTKLQNPTIIGEGDDPWKLVVMPFPFSYDNSNITNVFVYGNGFISLNSTASPFGTAVPAFGTAANKIYYYGQDLVTAGTLSYKVEGTSPFRVLTVQHLGARVATDNSGASFDVQVKFYETTNEIKIIFGNVSGIGGNGVNGWLGFVGNSNLNYINIQPNDPLIASTFYYSNVNPNLQPWLKSVTKQNLPNGKSYTLTNLPTLQEVYPNPNVVLARSNVYSGDLRPYVRINRSNGQANIGVKYKITGPIGDPNPITLYTGLDQADVNSSDTVKPDPQPVGSAIRLFIPHAKDIGGRLSDGALDLLTNKDQIKPGEYNVAASLVRTDGVPYSFNINTRFTIAFDNDLAITQINSPVPNKLSIYSYGGQVPISFRFKNQGATPVSKFKANYKIYKLGSTVPVDQSEEDFNLSTALQFNEFKDTTFYKRFPANVVGKYYVVISLTLVGNELDDFTDNNVLPRSTDPQWIFEVGYEIEAEPIQVITPASSVYNNRPFRPMVRFRNNGVSDISDTQANITIKKDGTDVYNVSYIVQDIPKGVVNYTDVIWPEMFTPTQTGIYQMTVNINANGDAKPENNTLTYSFNVIGGLSGTYSISQQVGSNFKTIDEAISALYERGVAGPVKFLLKDPVYDVGNENFFAPAIDLSSTIVGVNSANTITFTVDPVGSNYSSTRINLRTASGIGVYIAQNNTPNHINAVVRNVLPSANKYYANSTGYIIFDGGPKQSLLFTLYTASNFRSVFYLGDGASDNQIRNCVIQDGLNQDPVYNCTLPLSSFNASLNKFTYQSDNNTDGTFSAAVLLRSTTPYGPVTEANDYDIDTLVNKNNMIYNNEIKRFGYGVVSIGLGATYLESTQAFTSMYNEGNHVENNDISQVGRAGIFFGYEKGSFIEGNRIYNVMGNCGSSSAGILLGGQGRGLFFGYSNTNTTITANEISGVSGSQNLYGIRIVQEKTDFINNEANFSLPASTESSIVINNMIWGFAPQDAAANIFGISLVTEKSVATNWATQTITPKSNDYFTKNDLISNNTIILNDDQVTNTGVVIAADIENVKNARMINNAFGISDPSINPSSPVTATVFYYGLHPKMGGLASDRNAYWFDKSVAALYRFVETDAKSSVLEQGSKFEFLTLDQWRPWADQDTNSVYGDFVSDHQLVGFAPYKMRIKSNPYPLGSILNNRGSIISGNERDIDGNKRGIAGEMYDIGAIEFRGRTYSRDLEILNISAPAVYQATAPAPFSDAIYIMTEAPVKVEGIIRNNGSLPASAIKATFTAYRQTPSGGWVQEFTTTAPITDLLSFENAVLDFKTADGSGTDFVPQTYSDLANQGYTVPVHFRSMIPNVTPLYRLVISVPTDEHNANNQWEKIVRFYLKRSSLSILISGQNLGTISTASTLDSIASNLNVDSLEAGFNHLGWVINYNKEQPSYDYDVFDRKAWEPRSTNYTIYRSLFWCDGIDTLPGNQLSLLTRYDKDDINNFLSAGTFVDKKNLVINSQEMVSNESTVSPTYVRNLLDAKYANPFNPLGPGESYDGRYVIGVFLDRYGYYKISSTQFPNDKPPFVGLFDIDNPGVGVSRIGFKYKDHFMDDSISNPQKPIIIKDEKRVNTVVTTYPLYNKVYSAVDWRHWDNIEYYLRAVLNYLNSENGNVVPIDLLSFDAYQAGKRVDLNWSTASETNSSHFEIERADIFNGFKGNYSLLGRVDAIGNSDVTTEYGPFTDVNVEYGNTYAYRLRMIDRDGGFSYSKDKILTVKGEGGNMKLGTVNPNPVNSVSNVTATFDHNMNVRLYVIDESGREVATLFDGAVQAGTRSFDLNASQLSDGSYTLVLTNGSVNLTTGLRIVR